MHAHEALPPEFGPREQPAAGPDPPLVFRYRNHAGEVAVRRVVPYRLWYGSTEWHPQPQWLLAACDLDRQAIRDFALSDILSWGDGG